MLTFLTGIDTEKKRNEIEEAAASFLGQGKRVYIIVPEQSAFDRDRDLLLRFKSYNSDFLFVTGLERFVCEALEENGLVRKPAAEAPARAAIMSLAVEAESDSLEIFASHGTRPSSVNVLVSAYDELKQAGASPESLGKVSSGTVSGKARELSRIFSAYDALINERFSDSSDNISRLCDFMSGKHIFENTVFFFDDFRGFTGAQIRLLALLSADSDEAFVSVNAPDFNDGDGNEAFRHSRRNARAIRAAAEKQGVACFEKCTDSSEEPENVFGFLRSSLFSPEECEFEGNADNVCVYEASDIDDECAFVAMNIKKLLESGEYRCRDIGIFQRSGIYTDTLTSVLKKCGIPVYEDSRKPLGEFPLVRMILSAVEAAVRGLCTQRIFTYLKTGVAGISDSECDALENYVTLWSIDGKRWESDFAGNPAGYGAELDSERLAELEKINEIRRKAVAPLMNLRDELSCGEPFKSCAAVYRLIDETGAKGEFLKLAAELDGEGNEKAACACARVWDETADALDTLYNVLGRDSVSPMRFFELLTLILCGDSLGDIPAGIDQIIIGTADRTRFLRPKAVFVLGLSEGDFPQNSVRDGIFGAEEKRELAANGINIETTPENVYSEERLIAYNAVTAPSDRLYLSFSRLSLSDGEKQPSEVIGEIKSRLPSCKKMKNGDFDDIARAFNPYAGLDMYASVRARNDVFSSSLGNALGQIPGFAEKTAAVDYASDGIPASFADRSLSERLFGSKLYISPSRLEAYSKCPFMYFCRYGIKAKKTEPASLDARINGLLVHRVFEILLGKYSKDELSRLSYDERKTAVDTTADDYIKTNMGGFEGLSTAVLRQIERQKRVLLDILNRLISEFSSSSFEVSDVELEIKRGAEVEPFTVRDGGIEVTLHGTVDRVDTFRDGDILYFRVIDYKTGGKDFVLSDVFEGLNMQMLVYMTALWVNGHGKYEKAIPAGILYVPARTDGETLGRKASRGDIEAQKLKNGIMNGIVLKNESVLRGMESEAAGIFIKQKIVNGVMSGELYTLDDMKKIRRKLEKVIIGEVEKMLSGEIPALPVLDGAYKHTCEYCDFATVCRRESDGAKREYKKMKFDDAIRALGEEESI